MDFEACLISRKIEIKGFNNIYYFEFGKDFSHPPEKHSYWEMVYVDGGEIIAISDGKGRSLSQGQIIFHSPGELHAHVSNHITHNNMLVVSFSTDSAAMAFFDKKVFTLGKTEKTLLSLFIREATSALGKIPGNYKDSAPLCFTDSSEIPLQLLECYLTEFLLVLLRGGEQANQQLHSKQTPRELAHSSITELIVAYLNENVTKQISLMDICSKFYVGKSHLCKIFGEYTGMTPIEYHASLKIAEAKKLLRRDDMSIGAISDYLGYSSIHNFSRAFKKSVGVSPREYKNKLIE